MREKLINLRALLRDLAEERLKKAGGETTDYRKGLQHGMGDAYNVVGDYLSFLIELESEVK